MIVPRHVQRTAVSRRPPQPSSGWRCLARPRPAREAPHGGSVEELPCRRPTPRTPARAELFPKPPPEPRIHLHLTRQTCSLNLGVPS